MKSHDPGKQHMLMSDDTSTRGQTKHSTCTGFPSTHAYCNTLTHLNTHALTHLHNNSFTHECIHFSSQDIAVVPLLVLLPLIESSTGLDTASGLDLLQAFGPTILTTLGWVGALILGGRTILRRVFEVCMD